jgi:uncharacterized membrane protein YqjE
MQMRKEDRSLGDLFADLTQEMGSLIRQEIQLAQAETRQNITNLSKDAIMLIAGGAIVYGGFLGLMATLIIALANAMPWWLAALIVSVIILVIGGGMIAYGMQAMKHNDIAPRRTLDTLRDTTNQVRDQMR